MGAQSEYAMRDYTLRELRVSDRSGECRTVRQFQLLEWPADESAVDALLAFLSQVRLAHCSFIERSTRRRPQVHKTREQFGLEGPIAVHCSSGGRSGVFIGAAVALERLRAEALVDVFQTARLLRVQRAALLQTPQQLALLYRMLLAYLGAFEPIDC